MTILAFTTTERKVLEYGLESNRKIDSLKVSVAGVVADPREWDRVYLDTLVVLKTLKTLGTYTASLPNRDKDFYWYVPMSPSYIDAGEEKIRVPYCAYPKRYESNLSLIWNRLRRDLKLIVSVIDGTSKEETQIVGLSMVSHDDNFYKITWKDNDHAMWNVIYLHKGKKN